MKKLRGRNKTDERNENLEDQVFLAPPLLSRTRSVPAFAKFVHRIAVLRKTRSRTT